MSSSDVILSFKISLDAKTRFVCVGGGFRGFLISLECLRLRVKHTVRAGRRMWACVRFLPAIIRFNYSIWIVAAAQCRQAGRVVVVGVRESFAKWPRLPFPPLLTVTHTHTEFKVSCFIFNLSFQLLHLLFCSLISRILPLPQTNIFSTWWPNKFSLVFCTFDFHSFGFLNFLTSAC